MYYELTVQKPRSSNLLVSLSVILMVVLGYILAANHSKSIHDYSYYATSYSPALSRYQEIIKTGLPKPIENKFFQLPYSLISFDPVEIINRYNYLNSAAPNFKEFDLFLPDTITPDTTKKKDTLNVKSLDSLIIADSLVLKDTSAKQIIDISQPVDTTKKVTPVLTAQDSLTNMLFDSLMAIDSLRLIDSNAVKGVKRLALYDSSARIEHFKYKPADNLYTSLYQQPAYKLFGPANNTITYEVKIDSVNNMVMLSEKMNGYNVRIPVWMSLDDYIYFSRINFTRRSWEDIAHKYEFKLKSDKVEIGSLLSNITNIDIPIPENPLMSIFGDRSRINLRITGSVNIRGAFRSSTTEGLTTSKLGNTRSEPDFKQTVNIQVDGTIGDKLNINANWDTQRYFDYENQLKISYHGYEDEIIQSIEAGNVGISSTSSLVGSSQALFGVKAQMQIGPLKLTTVASQKKSEKKEMTLTGGSQKTPFEIRPYNYSKSHYFVDSVYRSTWAGYYKPGAIPDTRMDMKITDIEVWVTRPGGNINPEEREIVADIDLPELPASKRYSDAYQTMETKPGKIEVGRFIKLKSDQFSLNEFTGHITLKVSVDENQAIAVAYKVNNVANPKNPTVYGYFTNEFTVDATQTRVVLKLVKPANLMPAYKKAWSNQIKCIYYLQGTQIKKEALENVKMWYSIPGEPDVENLNGTSLLTIFGLDFQNEAGELQPDGKFDFAEGKTIDPYRGEIIFPDLEPFKDAFIRNKDKLDGKDTVYIFNDLYDTTSSIAQQNTSKNRFALKGEFSGGQNSTFRLGMSVVPGSVVVTLNGDALIAGTDYIIDEIGGQIIVKKEEALVPGANLQVKYEENDLISFSSKTLLGATGEMDIGKHTKIGFSWINSIQQSLSDKVRLGEEPINNHIFGGAWSSSFNLPFINSALNLIPFYSSNDLSSISLHGEAAYILPDPNTRKSVIDIDESESVAYIDDFEGARQYIPLGLGYGSWRYPSPPVELPNRGELPDSTVVGYKARSVWYNITPSDVRITDIWKEKRAAQQDQLVTYLTYEYYPDTRGQYNYKYPFDNSASNWGGVMKSLGSNAQQLQTQNYSFIELWMKVDSIASLSGAKMFIDLGRISEKVITEPKLKDYMHYGMHTEDGILPGSTSMNQKLEDGEDIGIDAIDDNKERELFPYLGDDPSGDNFSYAGSGSYDFSHINGYEGNGNNAELGVRYPDTEDLNHNSTLDQANSYYEYEIPLNLDEAKRSNRIVGGGNDGWYQYRIPLNQHTKTIGTPSLDDVQSVRFWVTGTNTKVVLKIAQFDIVGNQWVELKSKDSTNRNDSTFKISVVSIEETPEYNPPRTNLRARDRTRPDEEVLANEQSLLLKLNGLPVGVTKEAVKYYTMRPLDVFNYKTMRMFVHGDSKFRYIDETDYDVELIFKFGVDTANYYAYRMPLRPGWDDNNISISFEKLTTVKSFQPLDSLGRPLDIVTRIAVDGKTGHYYEIRGKPTLTNITYFSIGLKNPGKKGSTMPIYGDVWVDELRLCKANDSPGWAVRVDGSIKLANLGSVSFAYNRTNPDFHSVDTRFGNRNDDKSWSLNASLAPQNLLPKELSGTNLSMTYSRSETVNDPQYIPGTDIKVQDLADRIAQTDLKKADSIRTVSQTITVTETFAMPTIQFKVPSKKWYFEETINKMSFSFNYNSTKSRDPNTEWRKVWSWNFSTGYGLGLSHLLVLSPFTSLFEGVFFLDQYKDFKIAFLPDMSFGLSAARNRTEEKYRAEKLMRNPQRGFTASRSMNLKFRFTEGGLLNLSTDYTAGFSSNLTNLEVDTLNGQNRQRSNSEIFSDIFFKKGLIDFGQDLAYNQTISIGSKPAIPKILNLDQYLEFSADYKVDYKWQNNLSYGELGKSCSFTSSINSSAGFKLKSLADKIFGSSSSAPEFGGRRRGEEADISVDTLKSKGGKINISDILKALIKIPLLDYDNINITFTQTNSSTNGGIPGATGFSNIFGRVPFFQGSLPEYGPSIEYQLGLISDPTGKLVNFGSRSKFPFFGFDMVSGMKAPNKSTGTSITENFSQTNSLSFNTSRNLFEGVSINLNWKVNWSYNRNTNMMVDTSGFVKGRTDIISSNFDRSFVALPDFFLFKLLGAGGIQKVSDIFEKSLQDLNEEEQNNLRSEKLAQAFEEGFEAFPIITKIIGSIAPRVNWSIRWSGLEKIPFLSKFVNSLSINHSYSSSHTKRFKIDQNGVSSVEGQRISFNFSPLIGADFSFKELFGGSFSANFRYTTGQGFDLSAGASSIIEQSNSDISGSASFAKQGLEIPLFGLYLKNDIDFSISFGFSNTARKTYTIQGTSVSSDGVSDDNTSRTTFEPRFNYVISSKVRGGAYYRYTKSESARLPSTSSNEVGLDVTISIN